MKFNIEKMIIILDQNDFEELKDEVFEFHFQDLSLVDTFNVFKEFENKNMEDFQNMHDLSKKMFTSSLVKWVNVLDNDNNEIELNEDNKNKFYENNPDFSKMLIEKLKEKKENLKKKL